MSAAGGAGAGAGSRVGARASTDVPMPNLRTVTKYNAQQIPISEFNTSNLGFQLPPSTAGKAAFYRDGAEGISVPLLYNGDYAMNTGFIVNPGKFDVVSSILKGDTTYQLVANYPVHATSEPLPAGSDERRTTMHALLRAFAEVEATVTGWITADKTGRMFGVPFSAEELASKVRVDGKTEKGKFSSLVYAGITKAGEPMLLKSYLKLPVARAEDDSGLRIYGQLTLNGKPIAPTVENLVEHINWKNDVGIVFSFRDIYKSAYGISVRVRIDILGAWAAPKPVFVPISNPFLKAGATIHEDEE